LNALFLKIGDRNSVNRKRQTAIFFHFQKNLILGDVKSNQVKVYLAIKFAIEVNHLAGKPNIQVKNNGSQVYTSLFVKIVAF
jgi:hypothetical protein